MTALKGILFHIPSGLSGNSLHFVRKLDVAKITDVSYRKRLLRIRKRLYPYTMRVHYKYDDKPGIIYTNSITFRYRTEKEIQDEIEHINKKQKQLESYKDKIIKEMYSNGDTFR